MTADATGARSTPGGGGGGSDVSGDTIPRVPCPLDGELCGAKFSCKSCVVAPLALAAVFNSAALAFDVTEFDDGDDDSSVPPAATVWPTLGGPTLRRFTLNGNACGSTSASFAAALCKLGCVFFSTGGLGPTAGISLTPPRDVGDVLSVRCGDGGGVA